MTQSIGGPIDYAALTTPPNVCTDCLRTYLMARPRPPFCWCPHTRTAAKQRRDRTWKVVTDLTAEQLDELDELAKLQAGHE
jgi:hypothetical protein